MTLLLPLMVATGWLSDHVGRRPVMMAAAAFAIAAAWPLFWLKHSPILRWNFWVSWDSCSPSAPSSAASRR
jgi:MFS family permease